MSTNRPFSAPSESHAESPRCPHCQRPKSRRGILCRPCQRAGQRETTQQLTDRFWSKVDQSGICWVWTGAFDAAGYGRIKVQGRGSMKAPRVAWMLTTGKWPGEMDILHSCDNPPCVRPLHLRLGSQLDNARDALQRGRIPRGERHVHSRHSDSIVSQAKAMRRLGLRLTTISHLLDVKVTTVRYWCEGRSRRDAA